MIDNGGMPGNSVVAPVRTVLIVEDSATVAATLEMAAQEIPGVAVLLAATGVEALRILEDDDRDIHGIVTSPRLSMFGGRASRRRTCC